MGHYRSAATARVVRVAMTDDTVKHERREKSTPQRAFTPTARVYTPIDMMNIGAMYLSREHPHAADTPLIGEVE